MSVNPTSRFSLSDPQTSSIAQESEREVSERSRTPSPSILYHPSEGPTPGRQTSIKSIPSTIEREQRRVDALSQDLTGPEFDDLMKKIEEIKSNIFLKTVIENQHLQAQIERVDDKYKKKCFSMCQVLVLEKKGGKLSAIGSESVDKLFFSSSKSELGESISLVGVDAKRLRSSVGNEQPFSMIDYHSERACLQWLADNIADVARCIFTKLNIKISSTHIVHINMITRYSSCRHCAVVFGGEHNPSRIPDGFYRDLKRGLFLMDHEIPHVTLIHQGLEHHHHSSKSKVGELPTSEFFYSSSFKRSL